MSEQQAEAKKAFGIRLRDLRLDARLSGRQLSAMTGMRPSKISRIEHARQNPTEDDIRTWCRACSAENQIPELIAAHRQIDEMWQEHRQQLRQGLKNLSAKNKPLYERTKLMRVYTSLNIPGFLQKPMYVRAVVEAVTQFHKLPDNVDEAVKARLGRLQILTSGPGQFAFAVEASALYVTLGDQATMDEQFDFLIAATRMNHVSLGIIPLGTTRNRVWAGENFYIFDEHTVRSDQWTGTYETSRPIEISTFLRIFNLLREQAVYGDAARAEIEAARRHLQSRETS
ncbi:Scr1 family TA system antitoxin-like transcriptional regulator [Streptosporangium sp. V21-05]|uniref:Scr1 family TA system antitoxin-like transcriptional regulator n=1 Tax=Streptosporangium sp. V21-05 TaxID=3446115 RepID=UPI003F52A975